MSLLVRSPIRPQAVKVRDDALGELGVAQQRERHGFLLGAHLGAAGTFGGERRAQVLRLQLFELQQQRAQIVLDDLFGKAELRRCLRGESGARLRRVKVEGVEMEALATQRPLR